MKQKNLNRFDFVIKYQSILEAAFPKYTIRLFPDADDDYTYFAYVFCVPDELVKQTKEDVRAVLVANLTEWADIIPAIKSLSVTKQYYPQYIRSDV